MAGGAAVIFFGLSKCVNVCALKTRLAISPFLRRSSFSSLLVSVTLHVLHMLLLHHVLLLYHVLLHHVLLLYQQHSSGGINCRGSVGLWLTSHRHWRFGHSQLRFSLRSFK
eukprot:COSAG01_NODE_549_length_15608_cov_206.443355_10_plen_111_part_00